MNPKLKLALGIGLLALSLVLGNTLAANISLNSGGNVEFGQGVALTTACDDEVTVTPYSTFVNEAGAGDFIFTNLSVSDISGECDGKIFTIKAYEDGSDDPLDLYLTNGEDYYNSLEVLFDNEEFTLVDAGLDADDIVTDEGNDADANGFTVTLFTAGPPPSEAVASARDVYRITIESRDADSNLLTYSVGDEGPAGGIIFYVADSPQSWGTYIEAAPAGWNGSSDDVVSVWCSNPFLEVNDLETSGELGVSVGNTENLRSPNCTSGLSYVVDAYEGGGKSDWLVPSKEEMITMFAFEISLNLSDLANGYWTSNGQTGANSWIATTVGSGGGVGGYNKSQTGPFLRPIRYFGPTSLG